MNPVLPRHNSTTLRRRYELSPLRGIYTTLRAGLVAGAAFMADDLDAAEQRTISDLGINLVQIQPGTFMFGSPPAPDGRIGDEGPQTRVTISKPFWLGATEVTVGQWRRFIDATGYRTEAELTGEMSAWIGGPTRFEKRKELNWRNPGYPQLDSYPVVGVTWNDAQKFCAWLNERERAAGRLPAGYVFTLPTEAQWEYACTTGGTGPDMEKEPHDYAWHAQNSDGHAHPVGTKKPNPWGLYDMIGNAWEWVNDWYGKYPGGSVTDPTGPASATDASVLGKIRENRGNGWNSGPGHGTSPKNRWNSPNLEMRNNLGFRIALAPAR